MLTGHSPGRCGYSKSSPADCPSQAIAAGNRKPSSDPDFYVNNGNKTYTTTEYDAHYSIGNYYQYNAATANKGGSSSAGNVADSICPKGWKLPGSTTEYASFLKTETSTANLLSQPPYYFARGGSLGDRGLDSLGYEGNYWTSASKNTSDANYFFIYSSTGTSYDLKRYGYAARYVMLGTQRLKAFTLSEGPYITV